MFELLVFCGVGYLVIPLYDLLKQVELLVTWNTGFFVRYLVILWCEYMVLLQVEVLVFIRSCKTSAVRTTV